MDAGPAKEESAALRAGASPDACDPDGRCALAVAAAGNKTDCVRLLLARGAALEGAGDAGDEKKPTPLAAAAAADAAAAVWMLRDRGAPGADVALTAAAGACAGGAVAALLSQGPGAATPDGAAVDGRGALHVAAANGDIATVPVLLKAGANASKVIQVQEEYDETYTVPLVVARGERASGPAPIKLLQPRGPGGERGNLPCVAWSPDGRSLGTVAEAGGVVQLFDAATGAPGAVLGNHDYCPFAVVHGGTFVASGGCDNKIKFFDVKSAACVVTIDAAGADGGSGACVAYLALRPDGKQVAAATRDGGAIRIYNTAGGGFERELNGHAGEWVRSVAWSADGAFIASGGDDTKVWVWSVKSGDKVAVLEGHTNSPYGVAFSPDGRLASAGDRSVRVWASGADGVWSCVATKGDLPDGARSVAWSADGKLLAAGLDEGSVEVWDAKAPYDLAAGLTRTHGGGWVNALHFSPDSAQLATAGLDGNVELYDVVDAADGSRTLRAFEEKTRPATRTVPAPSALHLAAEGGGGSNSIHMSCLRSLLAAGADVGARDGKGRTPLHAAAAAGNLVAVHTLMAAGADLEATDGEGKKACEVSYDGAVLDALNADADAQAAKKALLKRCVGLTPAELDWARTSPAFFSAQQYIGYGMPAKDALSTMLSAVLLEYSMETTSAKMQAFAASFAAKAGAVDAPSLAARRKLDADVKALCAALAALDKGDAKGAAAACAAAPPAAVRAAALQAWELFDALKVDTTAAFAAAAELDAEAEAAKAAESAAMEEEFGKMAEAMGSGEPDQARVELLQSQIAEE